MDREVMVERGAIVVFGYRPLFKVIYLFYTLDNFSCCFEQVR